MFTFSMVIIKKCIGKESAVTAAAAVPAVELVTEETQVRMSEATTTSASMPMECLYAQAVLNMIDGYSFGQGGSQVIIDHSTKWHAV